MMTFLVNEGIEDPNNTKNGPSSIRQRTQFKWRFAGGPIVTTTLKAGLVAM